MMYEPAGHLLIPHDTEAPQRVVRLRELGLGSASDPEFDEFARMLATTVSAPFGMVNFINEERQFYAGLYSPVQAAAAAAGAPLVLAGEQERIMTRDRGWCPHVVVRRLPLVLDDVCDYPRFAGNPVVDEAGIRSYLGAPLIDRTGVALGTICVADREPRPWGRAGLEFIKGRAADLVERIHQREAARQAAR
jgi:GAF domain-containing protein